MVKAQAKSKIISSHQTKENDTGSPEVQIAIFSKEIDDLAKHLKKHNKDNSSRRGLLRMVAKRRRLLESLKRVSEDRHAKITKKLGLKK